MPYIHKINLLSSSFISKIYLSEIPEIPKFANFRAKRKWKEMLNTDEMTLAYELDWLRLKEIQEDNDNDEVLLYQLNEVILCVKKRHCEKCASRLCARMEAKAQKRSQRGGNKRSGTQFPLPLSLFFPYFLTRDLSLRLTRTILWFERLKTSIWIGFILNIILKMIKVFWSEIMICMFCNLLKSSNRQISARRPSQTVDRQRLRELHY